jgi:hypothetical protein
MESDISSVERIDNLDETMVLGYFESIKSVFLLKSALLWGLESTELRDEFYTLVLRSAAAVAEEFGDSLGFKALQMRNPEARENLKEDIMTGTLLSAWVVFEQITREVPNPSYASDEAVLTAGFERNVFGFTKDEKADLEFFQYLRHGVMHYNGAYYAYRSIDHTYNGKRYESKGHFGEKMVSSLETAWAILLDIEKYSLKAWNAVRGGGPRGGGRRNKTAGNAGN